MRFIYDSLALVSYIILFVRRRPTYMDGAEGALQNYDYEFN